MPKLLPIFPLELVLLPGVPLPLHIFEPRYKEMIGECLAAQAQFGVVRAKPDEGIAELGCTAEITSVLKRYDDGRMDIATVGRRRFEILEIDQERSFLQAEVAYVDDDENPGLVSQGKRERAMELCRQVQSMVGAAMEIDAEAAELSYQIAGALPIDMDFKQALLGIRSEPDRLSGLIDFFETILPKLEKAVRRREKAGGNGHVP